MKALKALVIGMGILIVAGTAVVIVTIFNRLTGDESPLKETAAAESFGHVDIGLAPGDRIEDMVPDGDRLFLHVSSPDGTSRVIVVDLDSGVVAGTIGGSRP